MMDMDALKRIGINTEEGLAYCADDPEFYEEMIIEYLNESGKRTDDLKKYFTERSWQQYGICVHSIKSTSKMIGASALSEHAREMEFAAKEGNTAALTAGSDRFLTEYMELVNALRMIAEEEG